MRPRILSSKDIKDLRQEVKSIRKMEKSKGVGRKYQTKISCPSSVATGC